MTIAVDLGRKATNKQTTIIWLDENVVTIQQIMG